MSVRAPGQRSLEHTGSSGGSWAHPVADAYILWRLFKQALHRTVGVPVDAPLLVTLFTVGVLANALRRLVAPTFKVVFRPSRPSLASTLMAGAVVREIPGAIAGERAKGTPFAGSLIVGSLLVRQHPQRAAAPMFKGLAALLRFIRRYGV